MICKIEMNNVTHAGKINANFNSYGMKILTNEISTSTIDVG